MSEQAIGQPEVKRRTGGTMLLGRIYVSDRTRYILRQLFTRPTSLAGMLLLAFFIAVAVLAPVLAPPQDPANPFTIPHSGYQPEPALPSAQHIFGTTERQFDIFYGIVWGTRTAFEVGIVVTLAAVIFGVSVGSVAGYYGGWVDDVLMRIVEVVLAFPFLLAAITLAAVLIGAGSLNLTIANVISVFAVVVGLAVLLMIVRAVVSHAEGNIAGLVLTVVTLLLGLLSLWSLVQPVFWTPYVGYAYGVGAFTIGVVAIAIAYFRYRKAEIIALPWLITVGAVAIVVFGVSFAYQSDPSKFLQGVVFSQKLNGLGVGMIALAAFGWPTYSRLIRAEILTLKQRDFVTAAKAIGASDFRILWNHILPNAIFPTLVYASLDIGSYVISFSALSFLGLGAEVGYADWGQMISFARNWIPSLSKYPHIVLFPGLAILLFVMAWNLIGDAFRDIIDPRLGGSR